MIPKRLRAKREEFLSCSILESLEIGSLAIPWVHKSLFARVVKWESSKRALITRPAAASEAVEEAVSIFLVGEFVSLYVRKICILLRPYEIFGWLLPACLPSTTTAKAGHVQADFLVAASGRSTHGICAKAPSSSWCSSFCAVFNNESLSLEFSETSRGRCGQWNVTLHIVT